MRSFGLIRTDVSEKVVKLEENMIKNDKRLDKVEHNWNSLIALVTVGSAALTYIITYVADLFGINVKK